MLHNLIKTCLAVAVLFAFAEFSAPDTAHGRSLKLAPSKAVRVTVGRNPAASLKQRTSRLRTRGDQTARPRNRRVEFHITNQDITKTKATDARKPASTAKMRTGKPLLIIAEDVEGE